MAPTSPTTPTVTLTADDVCVEVEPGLGGRIAQIDVGGVKLLCAGPRSDPIRWGSYPMAPWVGRLRHGRFRVADVEYQVELDHEDADGSRHAIHGTVYTQPWTVDAVSTRSIELHCELHASGVWPFTGTARQRIALTDSAVRCELVVESERQVFPVSIGWHPWFRKPEQLEFHPLLMYRRADIGLPANELVEPVAGPWDDTFINTEPVIMHFTSARDSWSVTVTSDCDHWVIFDHPVHATCIEPQSGPPDSPNANPQLIAPGSPLKRWMTIAWRSTLSAAVVEHR